MSFTFNWPRFSDQFHYDAIQMLNTALNKGNKPPIIADRIEVVELEMGSQPPELEIRDIGDLTVDQFRGIFRMTYAGDAHLVLKTKVQANPLNHKQPDIHLMAGSRGMLAAKQALVVPMLLRLSHFKLSSYVVLVISKQKGITLVFKTDPLQNVDINSTFDSITVIQNFIQREIEGQLRQMFREDLPSIIHRLSQQWVKAKVEAPYLSKRPPPLPSRPAYDATSAPDIVPHGPIASDLGLHPHLTRKTSMTSLGSRRPRSTSGMSAKSASKSKHPAPSVLSPSVDTTSFSHPDLENFDPTYGLRPEGLPTKSVFKGFSSLFVPNKGLADLAEEIEASEYDEYEEEEDEVGSFDFVDWVDGAPISPPPSIYDRDREQPQRERENSAEFETIPAVGGGTITRPRVFHSQSAIQPHSAVLPSKPISHSLSRSFSQSSVLRSGMATPSTMSRHPGTATNSYFPEYPAGPSRLGMTRPPSGNHTGRPPTPDSLESQPPSRSSSGPTRTLSTDLTEHSAYDSRAYLHPGPSGSTSTQPLYMRRPSSERRMSVTSETSTNTNHTQDTAAGFLSTSPSGHSHLNYSKSHSHEYSRDRDASGKPKIVIRPSLNNNSIHQLSTLSHSNHTLSPYTRDLSHFTVRSVPPRSTSGAGGGYGGSGVGSSVADRPPVKAKRKRMFRLGGQKKPPAANGDAKIDPNANASTFPDASLDDDGNPIRRDRLEPPQPPASPTPPSEFDVEDMDRYFPSAQEIEEMNSRRRFNARLRHPASSSSQLGSAPSVAASTSGYRHRPSGLRRYQTASASTYGHFD